MPTVDDQNLIKVENKTLTTTKKKEQTNKQQKTQDLCKGY